VIRLKEKMRLVLLVAAGAAVIFAQSADEIVARSCKRENENLSLRRQYTYRRTDDIKQLRNESEKQRELKTYDILYIDGTEYKRLVEKDGRPLPEKEAREEQAKLGKEIAKHKGESDSDRRKRRENEAKQLDEDRKVRLEIPKDYRVTLLGQEGVNGRSCWKIQAEPKPDYKPVNKDAKFLPKMHGTIWIDQQNYEWAKVDAESLDTISAGFGLLRVGKGFRFILEQRFVNEEIWAPVSIQIKASARALLFVGGNFDVRISFQDYRKYSVSSTVLGTAELSQ